MEVVPVLFNCNPDLPKLLPDRTRACLSTLAELRVTDSTSDVWHGHLCACLECSRRGVTAQDVYIAQAVYDHINSNRTEQDATLDLNGAYAPNAFSDLQLMFEVALDLRTADGSPRPGLGLSIIDRCILCKDQTERNVLAVQTDSKNCPPGDTQFLLNQRTGQGSDFHRLIGPLNEQQLSDVHAHGGTLCRKCKTPDGRFQDTVLPFSVDPTSTMPPMIRINKPRGSPAITRVSDTVTI
jgi:hypothetical protein